MKLTFIWQDPGFTEREWISDLFSFAAGDQIVDGNHQVVLDDCLLIDCYLHARPASYYEQFRGRNAWLIHLSDETYEGGYDAYRNFRGVFRNYWSNGFNPGHVVHLPLGYSDGCSHLSETSGIEARKYLWSFLGVANKSSRPEMLGALLPLEPHFVHRTDIPGVRPLGKHEYQRMLYDSIFVPCPMGNVNLDSFRVYEALEAGAIPIVEKRARFDYFTSLLGTHPLPTFSSWAQAAHFITVIRGDHDALSSLQKQSFDWWTNYKQILRQHLEAFLATSREATAESSIRQFQSYPGWQFFELARHQTLSTFARRARLTSQRLLNGGRLRRTTGA